MNNVNIREDLISNELYRVAPWAKFISSACQELPETDKIKTVGIKWYDSDISPRDEELLDKMQNEDDYNAIYYAAYKRWRNDPLRLEYNTWYNDFDNVKPSELFALAQDIIYEINTYDNLNKRFYEGEDSDYKYYYCYLRDILEYDYWIIIEK